LNNHCYTLTLCEFGDLLDKTSPRSDLKQLCKQIEFKRLSMTPLNLKNLRRNNLDPKLILYGLVINHLKKGQPLSRIFEK
jgi:hypothetical protein